MFIRFYMFLLFATRYFYSSAHTYEFHSMKAMKASIIKWQRIPYLRPTLLYFRQIVCFIALYFTEFHYFSCSSLFFVLSSAFVAIALQQTHFSAPISHMRAFAVYIFRKYVNIWSIRIKKQQITLNYFS